MQPNLDTREVGWGHPHAHLLEQRHLLQLNPPFPCFYRRFTYPEPPASAMSYYPSFLGPTPQYVASVDLTPGTKQNLQHQQQSQERIQRQPEQQIHTQTQQQPRAKEQFSLPKLTIEMLKCHIKPADRSANHEFSLPAELEPYLGKGWMCRYYHSTPAWGFIPPKGSGIRRADGFKALMARFELLELRKKIAEDTTKDVKTEVADGQDMSTTRKHRKEDPKEDNIECSSNDNSIASPTSVSIDHDVLMRGNEPRVTMPNRKLLPYEAHPEPYTAYSIYFRLEHMRILQESGDIDLHFQSSIRGSFYDPLEHPRPEKYKHCVLPPYWYSSAHRENVGRIMKRLCKRPWTSTIDAASEIISTSWCSESIEVCVYCEKLAQVEKTKHGESASPGSLKRASKSSPGDGSTSSGSGEKKTSTKKLRLASKEISSKEEQMKRQVEKSSVIETDTKCLNSFRFTKYSEDDQVQNEVKGNPENTRGDGAVEELLHRITFELTGSQEEGSSATTLRTFTSDHVATSGIGLLAHVASLLG
ncbi:hypothetical protein ACHAW6_012610 [Cyclotella cf. meneghiniana]